MTILGTADVAAGVVVGKRHVVGRSDGHLSGGVTLGAATRVGNTEAPADVATVVLDEGYLIEHLGVVLGRVVHLVDERLLEVGIQVAGLQLDEFLAVVLGHLIVFGVGAGGLLGAVHVFIGHGERVCIHVEVFVGALHGSVLGHAVAGTEECDAGNEADGEVAVHALNASGVHVAPLHGGLNVYQLLKATAVDDVLVGARLVNLIAPLGCDVVVGHIAEEVAHQIVAISLQTGGFTLDLLHFVLLSDAAVVDTCAHLVGTLNSLKVVVPYLLHVAPSHVASSLKGPHGITVVGGGGGAHAHGFHVGVLHPYAAHTRCVWVFTEQNIYAVDGVGCKFCRVVDHCLVHLRRRVYVQRVAARCQRQGSDSCNSYIFVSQFHIDYEFCIMCFE